MDRTAMRFLSDNRDKHPVWEHAHYTERKGKDGDMLGVLDGMVHRAPVGGTGLSISYLVIEMPASMGTGVGWRVQTMRNGTTPTTGKAGTLAECESAIVAEIARLYAVEVLSLIHI